MTQHNQRMNPTRRLACLLALLCAAAATAWSQPSTRHTSDSTGRRDTHLSVLSGVYGGGGEMRSYMAAVPSVSKEVGERWRIGAKAALAMQVDPAPHPRHAPDGRSLVPRRNNAGLMAAQASADYRASDNLTLGATVFAVAGQWSPLWHRPGLGPQDVSLYGFSAHMRYKTKRDNVFAIDIHYLHDDYGTLQPLLWDCYGAPYGWHAGNPFLNF